MVNIETLDTQQVWNALVGTDGWKRIIHSYRCVGKHCGMSGSWFAKLDMLEPGTETYRCPNCGTEHVFKIPYGGKNE